MIEDVTLEISGLSDASAAELVLEIPGSGFVKEDRGPGRSRRFSVIGDTASVVGAISSMVAMAKTILEILKLKHELNRRDAVSKEAELREVSVLVRTRDGREVAITSACASVSEVERLLSGLR